VIIRTEEEQRVSLAHNDVFHLGDEDGVIPGIASILKAALKVGQSSMENGCAMCSAVKSRSGAFRGRRIAFRIGIVLGNSRLLL
jgi:hypothetical protein